MFSFLAEIYSWVLKCVKNIDNHYECLSFRNWWFGGKKKKKSNSSETESNQSILPSVQLNVPKIPNYKISSSNLALILNFKWSRNFDRLAKVLRLTLEIWRKVNSCEFWAINLKVDFGISENLPQLSKRKEMNETIKTNFCLDKRIDTKNPPLWIDRSIFLLES